LIRSSSGNPDGGCRGEGGRSFKKRKKERATLNIIQIKTQDPMTFWTVPKSGRNLGRRSWNSPVP